MGSDSQTSGFFMGLNEGNSARPFSVKRPGRQAGNLSTSIYPNQVLDEIYADVMLFGPWPPNNAATRKYTSSSFMLCGLIEPYDTVTLIPYIRRGHALRTKVDSLVHLRVRHQWGLWRRGGRE